MSLLEELTDADIRQAYRELFDTPQGQIVWRDLLWRFGFTHKSTLEAGRGEALFAFNEGSRFVTLHIHNMVNAPSPQAQEEQER